MNVAALTVFVVAAAWILAYFRSRLPVWTVAAALALGGCQHLAAKAGSPWF